ncbi:MAG: class I SAM-dependent rRNA methyltransferase [Saprospiraceae bacterium]|nr:MAG: class I SAM-dependent rRNA methyltransferase [Saprospiraceae bacterium]
MLQVFLKPKKDVPVRRFHPWIFSGAIDRMEGEPADGDIVGVVSNSGAYLATGHFQNGSIAVRIFSFEKIAPGPAFWKSKLQKAFDYRRSLGLAANPATNCYRLVNAEGDGLPGLIVDVYGKTAVVQCHSIGMHRSLPEILPALVEVLSQSVVAVYDKSKETLPAIYAAAVQNGYLHGESSPHPVLENGHSFFVDWESGQKTGFFLDQRDNRQLLSNYVAGKTVLNAFCYSGGFSIYALNAGATSVHSVDVSQKAIEWTDKNVALNPSTGEHLAFANDVQKYLKDCGEYDVMVVDPPAFAKNLKKRHNAVQGYIRLNAAAFRKVAPGGMLFTFSCSQVVDRQLFYDTIVAAAIEAGRRVRVMHHLSQPADHPVSLFHPEGAYLKGLALQVE